MVCAAIYSDADSLDADDYIDYTNLLLRSLQHRSLLNMHLQKRLDILALMLCNLLRLQSVGSHRLINADAVCINLLLQSFYTNLSQQNLARKQAHTKSSALFIVRRNHFQRIMRLFPGLFQQTSDLNSADNTCDTVVSTAMSHGIKMRAYHYRCRRFALQPANQRAAVIKTHSQAGLLHQLLQISASLACLLRKRKSCYAAARSRSKFLQLSQLFSDIIGNFCHAHSTPRSQKA